MKIRVTPYSFFFALYVMLRLLPSYFSNGLVSLMDNFFALLAVLFLLLKKYKPSPFMLLASSYILLTVAMSFINKTDRADVHLIISQTKLIVFLAVTEWSLKTDTKRAVNTVFFVLLLYTVMDFLSIVLFPKGMYFNEIVWNQWSTSLRAQWLLGNKNNRVYWYMCMLMAACWHRTLGAGKYFKIILQLLTVMSLLAVILVNSMTSLVVLFVACIGLWLGEFSKKEPMFRIPTKWIYPGYLGFAVLWLSGSVWFLKPIIEGLLGRTMSFTNRTVVWARTVLYIIQKPVFGWGMFGKEATDLLGNQAFVNAHNQILETLWQSGIAGLILFSILMLLVTRSIGRISGNGRNVFFSFMFIAILVEMLAESILNVDATWLYLLLCIRFSAYVSERETGLIK